MKKILFLFAMVIASNFSYAQWTDDGTNVYLTNSSRNLGIGATSTYKMYVTQNFTDLAGTQYSPVFVKAFWTPTVNDMTAQGKAIEYQFVKQGAYNVNYIHGTASVMVNSGAGSISNMNAFITYITNLSSGTITNARAFYALSPGASSTNLITNAYGLFLDPQKTTGVSKGYGVFQTGGGDINYFAGNVLIGKTTQVNTGYILDVNGNIRSNQIVVNTTGADFVFAPNYKMYSLPALKKYLDKNHHLPEIPSAKQMQAEGLNVGDHQIKLLQKVEELTLYLIEKDNEIKDEKEKNRQLTEKLNKLEQRLDAIEKSIKK
jgi:hypothetical protein